MATAVIQNENLKVAAFEYSRCWNPPSFCPTSSCAQRGYKHQAEKFDKNQCVSNATTARSPTRRCDRSATGWKLSKETERKRVRSCQVRVLSPVGHLRTAIWRLQPPLDTAHQLCQGLTQEWNDIPWATLTHLTTSVSRRCNDVRANGGHNKSWSRRRLLFL